MITISMSGGTGNQLFQYALGRALEHHGREVQYDLVGISGERKYTLDTFGLKLKMGSSRGIVTSERGLRFRESLENDLGNDQDRTLHGYWQCEKYFVDVQDKIRAEMFHGMEKSGTTLAAAFDIDQAGENSVFVHLRRGDNARADHKGGPYDGLLDFTVPYYRRAFALAEKLVNKPRYFFFSDDPEYLRAPLGFYFGESISRVVTPERECEHLWLMSKCRHAIIANSTFSWWGAWLNRDEGKVNRLITVPDPWYATEEFGPTDIIPERWMKVAR